MIVAMILLDLYIVVLIGDWILSSTDIMLNPQVTAWVSSLARPYMDWVVHVVRPTWRGRDMSRVTGLALLMVARTMIRLAA